MTDSAVSALAVERSMPTLGDGRPLDVWQGASDRTPLVVSFGRILDELLAAGG